MVVVELGGLIYGEEKGGNVLRGLGMVGKR